MSGRKQHMRPDACEAENMKGTDMEEMVKKTTGKEELNSEDMKSDDMKSDDMKPDDMKPDETKTEDIRSDDINAEEFDSVRGELEEKTKQCTEYLDKLQRTAAEFDNFKKRSVKEKEALYVDAVSDVVCAFLPVLDNVERAVQAISADSSAQTLKDGVDMVLKQFMETFKCIGVEEIAAVNEQFDPMRHNAVMHVEDETVGHNTIVEEFQKGYIYKDKVIRYSMVKVAN